MGNLLPIGQLANPRPLVVIGKRVETLAVRKAIGKRRGRRNTANGRGHARRGGSGSGRRCRLVLAGA